MPDTVSPYLWEYFGLGGDVLSFFVVRTFSWFHNPGHARLQTESDAGMLVRQRQNNLNLFFYLLFFPEYFERLPCHVTNQTMKTRWLVDLLAHCIIMRLLLTSLGAGEALADPETGYIWSCSLEVAGAFAFWCNLIYFCFFPLVGDFVCCSWRVSAVLWCFLDRKAFCSSDQTLPLLV